MEEEEQLRYKNSQPDDSDHSRGYECSFESIVPDLFICMKINPVSPF